MTQPPHIRTVTALAAALVLAACRAPGDAGPAAGATIDTVAGVVHVASREPRGAWRAVPQLTLGSDGMFGERRPDEFGTINSVVADADGNVYVADAQSRDIRVFAPDGTHLRTIGRQGGGPGEFGALYSLAWLGDTLAALDPGNARIQLLDRDGAALDVLRWLPLTGPVSFVRFYPAGRDLYTVGLREPGWQGWSFVRHTAAGAADTISIQRPDEPNTSAIICRRPDGAITFITVPFAPQRLVAPAPDGRAVVAHSASYRIAYLDPAGDTLRVLTRANTPVPITDAEWEAETETYRNFRRDWPGATCEGTLTRAAHKPALLGLFFDHGGRLLVESQGEGGAHLDFFDDEGRLLGTLPLPERDRRVPPYVRGDRLYLVQRDSLDVQRVGVYRVERGG